MSTFRLIAASAALSVIGLFQQGCGPDTPDGSTDSNPPVDAAATDATAAPSREPAFRRTSLERKPADATVYSSPSSEQVREFRLRVKEALALTRDFRHEDAGAVLDEFLPAEIGRASCRERV